MPYQPDWTPGDRAIARICDVTGLDMGSAVLLLRDCVAGRRLEGRYRGRDAHYSWDEDRGFGGPDQGWRFAFLSIAPSADGRDVFLKGSEVRTADLDNEFPLAGGDNAKPGRDRGDGSARADSGAAPKPVERELANPPVGPKKPQKRRGPLPIERDKATARMAEDIRSGTQTAESLGKMKQDELAERYGVKSRETAREALKAAIVAISNSDK